MPDQLDIIMVPTTHCNLSCHHCFETRSERVMSLSELRVVMRELCSYAGRHDVRRLVFYWQGGEVLSLGVDWFEAMEAISAAVFENTGIQVRHRLQSNLVLYTHRWRPLVKRIFNNAIGSSLDYPSRYRGFRGIYGSRFNDIWHKAFQRAQADGINVSVIAVLNEDSLKIEPIQFLEFYAHQMGITSMQLNYPFSLHAVRPGKKNYFLDPLSLGVFLGDLFDTWMDTRSGWREQLQINPFNELLDAFAFAPRPSRCNCIWSGSCADRFFTVGPDSAVGLCDCWVTSLPKFNFGNLQHQSLEEVARHPLRVQLVRRIEAILNCECADCPYLGLCYGGCIIRTYGHFGTLTEKDPYCKAYRTLFARVERWVRSIPPQGDSYEKN